MRHFCAAILAMTAASARAGMIGDSANSTLHTAFAGSWTTSSTATVGPGAEFTRTDNVGGFVDVLTLDIAAASFTFTDSYLATGGSFNLGLDGFEFTDLNQMFIGISLAAGNTFPGGTFTGSSVMAHTIHIFMNEPIIPGGASWTATWNVNFAQTPEPASAALAALGTIGLALRRHARRN